MGDNPFESLEVADTIGLPTKRWGSTLLKVFLTSAIVVVLILLFAPAPRRAREAARRTQCKNNLKQIGVALHNYHKEYGSFPPAYTVDENGRPLHSWRTLLLPYLEQTALYGQIDLSKPWNNPVNAASLETLIPSFQCPAAKLPKNHTIYLGVAGEASFFHGSSPRAIADITDGTSNTLIVVEVPPDRSVPWMAPQDADQALIMGIAQGTKTTHSGGFQATLADGTVRFISVNIDRATLKALLTTSGDEVVGEF